MDASASSVARPAQNPALTERALYALVVAAAAAFYVPSLGFGYFYDDFWLLRQGLADVHPLVATRPAWFLPSHLLSAASIDPLFQRAVSLACFAAVGWVGYLLLRGRPNGPLILAVLLAHPWFVYPVTWISQRADLLWIAFTGLALAAATPRATAAWAALSMLAKAPFVMQGLVFAYRLFAQRAAGTALAVVAVFAVVVAASAAIVSGSMVEAQDAVGGFHTLKHSAAGPLELLGLFAITGAAKLLESLLMIFVPFPATYGTGALGIATIAASVVAWTIAAALLARGRLRGLEWTWLAVGLAASTAFVFLAQLRAIAPAGFFLVAGLLAGLPATRAARAALAVLLVGNLASSVALYRATDTGCHDIDRPHAARDCQEPGDLPIARWQRDRGALVQQMAAHIRSWR
jgi:hypothetical protein